MILDIILVTLFLLMMLYGYKKGCIGIIAKLVSLVLAFVLAYLLAEVVGGYISNTSFGTTIKNSIEVNTLNVINNTENGNIISMIQQNFNVIEEQKVVYTITNYVFTGIGFVITFLVARIVLWVAQKILENIFELPVLKTFNKLGGSYYSVNIIRDRD